MYFLHLFTFDIPFDWFIDRRIHGLSGMSKFFKRDNPKQENYLKSYRRWHKDKRRW